MHQLDNREDNNDEQQTTGGMPSGFTLQSHASKPFTTKAIEPTIDESEKHEEMNIKVATPDHDKQIALTRLIFRPDCFPPLGKTIAMFADCPLETHRSPDFGRKTHTQGRNRYKDV